MKPWGDLLNSKKSHIKNYTILYEIANITKESNDDKPELAFKKELMEHIEEAVEYKEEYKKDIGMFGENLKRLNITNIITTNYDGIIEKILKECKYELKTIECPKRKEKIYSVRRKKRFRSPDSNHIITLWKIHGDGVVDDEERRVLGSCPFSCSEQEKSPEEEVYKSLNLGLDQYCGYVAKLSAYVKGKYPHPTSKQENCKSMEDKCREAGMQMKTNNDNKGDEKIITEKNSESPENNLKSPWDEVSWVELFFNSELFISGFGMDFSEIDIWWIINRRARMMEKFKQEGVPHYLENKIHFLYSNCHDSGKVDIFEALEAFEVDRRGICTCTNYIDNLFKAIDEIDTSMPISS